MKIKRLHLYLTRNAFGSHNAKSRTKLRWEIGTSDRALRQMINTLRTQHNSLIISTSDRKGYFIMDRTNPVDINIAKHYIAENKHRINELHKLIKPVADVIFPEGQLRMTI